MSRSKKSKKGGGGGSKLFTIPERVFNAVLKKMVGPSGLSSVNKETKCTPEDCDPFPLEGTKCFEYCTHHQVYRSPLAQAARVKAVFDAIYSADMEAFEQAIRKPFTNLNARLPPQNDYPRPYYVGNTPLMMAIWYNRLPFVKALLKTGRVTLNQTNNRGTSPLGYAIRGHNYPLIMTLIHYSQEHEEVLISTNDDFYAAIRTKSITFINWCIETFHFDREVGLQHYQEKYGYQDPRFVYHLGGNPPRHTQRIQWGDQNKGILQTIHDRFKNRFSWQKWDFYDGEIEIYVWRNSMYRKALKKKGLELVKVSLDVYEIQDIK